MPSFSHPYREMTEFRCARLTLNKLLGMGLFADLTLIKLNSYSSSWPLKGYINDLRIYSTILSSDDILALYHTGAKVDNLGNLHTFEATET